MKQHLSINGRIVAPGDALVPALDRALLYGDGVFEVLRAYDGRPFGHEQHLARLWSSAERLGMSMPVSAATLLAELAAVLSEAGVVDAHVRLIVTRGAADHGLCPNNPHDATRLILVTPIELAPSPQHALGAAAMCVRLPWLSAQGPLAGAKTLNYLPNTLWTRQAREAGFDEALLLAQGELVLEGASSNLFLVRDGALRTPSLDLGILPGITRAFVLSCARALGLDIGEDAVTLQDLRRADEVFMTSSVRELLPIVRLDEHQIGDGAPGELTRRLHRELRALTPAAGRPMPWEI